MKMRRQAGFTLIESVAAAAVAAVAVAALAAAMSGFGRFAAHQNSNVQSEAAALAEQTLRVAADAWKYGQPGNEPAGNLATSLPLKTPGGAANVPADIEVVSAATGAASAQLAVTVRYTPDPAHPGDPGVVTLHGAVRVRAPLPGSSVAPAAFIAQPAGAP